MPDFVTMFTIAPAFLPYSASAPEMIGNSATASIGRIVAGVPKTPASLMAGSLR